VGALFNNPWLELFLLVNFHIAHSSSLSSNPTKKLKALGFEILLLQIQREELIHHFCFVKLQFWWLDLCVVLSCGHMPTPSVQNSYWPGAWPFHNT
jgi:hypothetical protein